MKTVNIAPAQRAYDVEHTRVEIKGADGWEPFCTNYGFYPISKTIGVFAQWSVVLPVKMRIVTNGNDVLCKS